MKRVFLMCILSAMLGALLAIGLTTDTHQTRLSAQDTRPSPRTVAPEPQQAEYSPDELVNIQVYENTNRSVVNINTRSVRPDAFFMFEQNVEGAGSGFVLDKNGHVLTNYHVVAGAREVRVTLFDGNTYSAGVVGQDPQNDIAVLRIDAAEATLFPVTLGDSRDLKVGQKAFAIGNPLGLERTMTVGIVSSLNRMLPSRNGRTMKSIIQIDAALNPGNSGGPLLSSQSEVIGMNTAIASPSGAGENIGIGFAIPVGTIRRVVPQLIEHGRVIRADIGITRVYETEQGLVIATLASGGAAERAGLRGFRLVHEQRRRGPFIYEETRVDRDSADLIVAIDGERVRTVDELLTVVESKKPQDTVKVTTIRESKEVDVSVVLD